MKKLLLLGALVLGALTSDAQDLYVTAMGQMVPNGETVDLACLEKDEQEAFGMLFVSYRLMPELKIVSPSVQNLEITVTNTSQLSKPVLNFCWPSTCMGIDKGASLTRTGLSNDFGGDLGVESPWVPEEDMPAGGLNQSCTIKIVPAGGSPYTINVNMLGVENGVDGVMADESAPVYYNLQGVRVDNPDRGIYVVRQGGKTTKVIM